jgi:hypothetical protein
VRRCVSGQVGWREREMEVKEERGKWEEGEEGEEQ